jgi:predicted nucleic acid-binding protein
VRVALDTNVLAYAEGVNGDAMKQAALELIQKLPVGATLVPAQTLGELFNVLVRKAGRTPASARSAILSWSDAFTPIETSPAVMLATADLAVDHQFGIWDAVILAAAAAAGCRLLLSEDLHEGFTWRGVTLTNPFAPSLHPLLAAMLGEASP